MLPNRFPDQGEQPEFNSVDASLWYIIAVNDYLLAAGETADLTDDCHTEELRAAVEAILVGYMKAHVSESARIATACSQQANTANSSLGWMRESMAMRSRRVSENRSKFRPSG